MKIKNFCLPLPCFSQHTMPPRKLRSLPIADSGKPKVLRKTVSAALLKADSIGCYGSEFDVWLAADDQLVVNHDPTFKGKRMENSPSTALTAIKLDNGESLPTLAKYLKARHTATHPVNS